MNTVASMHGLSTSTVAVCTATVKAVTTMFVALEPDSDLIFGFRI